jgi:hypothetical protein
MVQRRHGSAFGSGNVLFVVINIHYLFRVDAQSLGQKDIGSGVAFAQTVFVGCEDVLAYRTQLMPKLPVLLHRVSSEDTD